MTEWKPLEIGGNPLAEQLMMASKGHTLRISDEQELKQVLRYSMLLVGLRANNLPTEEERFVLINFIKSNFGNVTVSQIKMAFDLAVSGKLGIDAKCYENFSCEYFGRIMSKFLQYSAEETRIISQRVIEDEPLPKPSQEELKAQAIEALNMYADQLANDPNFKWLAGGLHHLYDVAKELGLIKINADDKKAIWEKTKGDVIKSKSEAYKFFVNEMANFEMRFNDKGEIKPIE